MQSKPQKRIKKLEGSSYVVSLEKEDILGQGSFGKVVRAFDLNNESEMLCAKIIEITSQSNIEALKQEIKVLEAFNSNHHNLAGYKRYKLFSKKAYYIIMEYCKDGTLEDKISKTKRFSELEIYDFLSQFCSGYRELLRQGIIHRDLKPANILIHNRIYKIADFGLGKIVESIMDRMQMSTKGTPLYMPPEIILEQAIADPKVDIWSLGVIIYRMLFGVFPFLSVTKKYSTRDQAFNDILNNQLDFPQKHKRSPELIQLVRRMLEKDPIKRMSWEELFQAPNIKMVEANEVQGFDPLNPQKLMSSNLFVQQMVVQRTSVIQVQPFKEKKQKDKLSGILAGVNKVITEEDINQSQTEHVNYKDKVNHLLKDVNYNLKVQGKLKEIEDQLLFEREKVFFLDKVAVRISCLEKIIENAVCIRIAIFILQQALEISLNILEFKFQHNFTEEDIKLFKISDQCSIFEKLIAQDNSCLELFLQELHQKNLKLIEKEAYIIYCLGTKSLLPETFISQVNYFFEMSEKMLDTLDYKQKCQLFICLMQTLFYYFLSYLFNVVCLEEFMSQQNGEIENLWIYYEKVEKTKSEQKIDKALQMIIEKMKKHNF